MRVLFVGDIVGRAGRDAALRLVAPLRNELAADFVIANAENAAGGMGLTPALGQELLSRAPLDVLTLGNHAWAKREIYPYLQSEPRVLRPANYPPGAPGMGAGVYETEAGLVGVLVLQGRVFMETVDDPFRCADAEIERLRGSANAVIVDMHAEATSEKQAMAWHLAGRVAAVVGTHTHVQTADERIMPGGTAYISDVGMTGPTDSIIGMRRDYVMHRFITGLPSKFEVAEGPAQLSAALIDIEEASGRAREIVRIQRAVG
ncbi:MAG: TIGR00282 family metallophosphoesterase [Chthonomonadales bacterium]|nr:TIGR00282 family metallophosphoesterase [Chthonomonadales bacterium]